jgi:AcrR family transcriptional regulator
MERTIRQKTLELLMEKEPEEIGMRDIATSCGVTATTIYYYYADKECLFEAVKKDCMAEMDRMIVERASMLSDSIGMLRAGLAAFRDWAFANPRIALLVMNRFRPNFEATPEEMAGYYRSTFFGKELLERAVAEGIAKSDDPLLDSSLCISAMWGAIESILRFRTVPEYWDEGVTFTDAMIEMCCARLAPQGGK